jgi:hypothetical protein
MLAHSASNWCIVVADASGTRGRVAGDPDTSRAPIQFLRLAEPTTMRQKVLHRAGRISGHTSILVTAADPRRAYWHRSLWFIPAEHIFVSEFLAFHRSLGVFNWHAHALGAVAPERICTHPAS